MKNIHILKKILSFVITLLISYNSFGQFPATTSNGNANTLTVNPGQGKFLKGININFGDTASANLVTYMKGVPFTMISTSEGNLWQRDSTATRWVLVSGSGGTTSFCEGIQYGDIVTWDSLLVFSVTSGNYCINGVNYTNSFGTVVLAAADATLPRFDVIAVDTLGNIVSITGVPSANPSVPQIDNESQLYLTSVYIAAGATTPSGVANKLIWNENVGAPAEYVATNTGINTVSFTNTLAPFSGVYATFASSFTNVRPHNIRYTGDPCKLIDYDILSFYVKLRANFNTSTNIKVQLEYGGVPVTSALTISAPNGFIKNIKEYQLVSIRLSDFIYTADVQFIDGIKFTTSGTHTQGFYLDYIRLQRGVVNIDPQGNYITDIYRIQGTDSVMKVINGVAKLAFRDSIGNLAGGSIDYVVPGFGVKVDSVDRTYTVSADTSMLALKENVLVKQPLQSLPSGVSGVPDTLKFNPDSSGLVKDIYKKAGTDSVGKVVNGVWTFAYKDSVGSMAYPSAGIPTSTGTAWGTSIPNSTDGQVLTMVSGAPAWAAAPIGLPSMTGNNGKFLTTDGTVAGWSAVSAAAAGSDTYVQFNDGGTLGGIGTFTYNKTTGELYFTKTGSANYIKFKPNSTGTDPEIELFYSGGTSRSLKINSLNTVTINGSFAADGSVKGKGIVLGTNPTSSSGNVATTTAPEGAIILAPTGASSYINYTNAGNFFSAAAGTLSTNGDFVYYRNPTSITAFGGTEVYRIVRSTGNFLVGTSTDVASSIFTLASITKGFLPPRMTGTQRDAISSPAEALQLYNTSTKQHNYYDGVTWKAQVGMTFGTAAPAITPVAIGNFFLDTTNKKLYIATGTSSSSDWTILN